MKSFGATTRHGQRSVPPLLVGRPKKPAERRINWPASFFPHGAPSRMTRTTFWRQSAGASGFEFRSRQQLNRALGSPVPVAEAASAGAVSPKCPRSDFGGAFKTLRSEGVDTTDLVGHTPGYRCEAAMSLKCPYASPFGTVGRVGRRGHGDCALRVRWPAPTTATVESSPSRPYP